MLEVEVKVPITAEEREVLKAKLKELKADFLGKAIEVDVFLSHPCYDLGDKGHTLKLRVRNGEGKIILKERVERQDVKANIELETEVTSPRLFLEILKKLGFKETLTVKKLRETYLLSDVYIHFDEVDGLGLFVEVELLNHKVEKRAIERALATLGLEGKMLITAGYADLLSRGGVT
ncbi:MAG: class IV adenylate cyclase [Thermoprotei archaeon]|nr:MAG: class IV adenylate cyclase [Thermoprotei archaeon]